MAIATMTLGVRRSVAIRFDGTARQNAAEAVITDALVAMAVMAADGLVAAVGSLHGDGGVIFFGRLREHINPEYGMIGIIA